MPQKNSDFIHDYRCHLTQKIGEKCTCFEISIMDFKECIRIVNKILPLLERVIDCIKYNENENNI